MAGWRGSRDSTMWNREHGEYFIDAVTIEVARAAEVEVIDLVSGDSDEEVTGREKKSEDSTAFEDVRLVTATVAAARKRGQMDNVGERLGTGWESEGERRQREGRWKEIVDLEGNSSIETPMGGMESQSVGSKMERRLRMNGDLEDEKDIDIELLTGGMASQVGDVGERKERRLRMIGDLEEDIDIELLTGGMVSQGEGGNERLTGAWDGRKGRESRLVRRESDGGKKRCAEEAVGGGEQRGKRACRGPRLVTEYYDDGSETVGPRSWYSKESRDLLSQRNDALPPAVAVLPALATRRRLFIESSTSEDDILREVEVQKKVGKWRSDSSKDEGGKELAEEATSEICVESSNSEEEGKETLLKGRVRRRRRMFVISSSSEEEKDAVVVCDDKEPVVLRRSQRLGPARCSPRRRRPSETLHVQSPRRSRRLASRNGTPRRLARILEDVVSCAQAEEGGDYSDDGNGKEEGSVGFIVSSHDEEDIPVRVRRPRRRYVQSRIRRRRPKRQQEAGTSDDDGGGKQGWYVGREQRGRRLRKLVRGDDVVTSSDERIGEGAAARWYGEDGFVVNWSGDASGGGGSDDRENDEGASEECSSGELNALWRMRRDEVKKWIGGHRVQFREAMVCHICKRNGRRSLGTSANGWRDGYIQPAANFSKAVYNGSYGLRMTRAFCLQHTAGDQNRYIGRIRNAARAVAPGEPHSDGWREEVIDRRRRL